MVIPDRVALAQVRIMANAGAPIMDSCMASGWVRCTTSAPIASSLRRLKRQAELASSLAEVRREFRGNPSPARWRVWCAAFGDAVNQ